MNAFHGDSSACILVDGELVAAAEEERFRRLKHWAGFPAQSMEYCLREAGLTLDVVDHIALNRDPKANVLRKVAFVLRNRPKLRMVLDRLANTRAVLSFEKRLLEAFPSQRFAGRIHQVEHHLAHLASAFLVSPFEEAVVLSVDGFGDFASTAWGFGRGNAIKIHGRVHYPHSLGAYYQAVTQFLGFLDYGDEYKVMGLAPYGSPSLVPELRKLVQSQDDGSFRLNLAFFQFHRESVTYEWNDQIPTVDPLFSPALEDLLGPARMPGEEMTQRHKDIAHSAQTVYEEVFFRLINALSSRYDCDALALAGGCAQNSVANGKISSRSPFSKVYLPPATPDAGGAIGAAAHVWHSLAEGSVRSVTDTPFLGPEFSTEEIDALLGRRASELRRFVVYRTESEEDLCKHAAVAAADGKVVGWFQGRMEWGPRALGNRSIICDPRRPDMKDILNRKIKRRESFRPFAPSVMRSAVSEWFEMDDDVPFMSKVFTIKEDKRALIPAVTHVDGSGRLQTVEQDDNPRYFALISAFQAVTDVPMVLNTSFNENEPIVCRPEEALDCFLRTDMDVLVLNEIIIERRSDVHT